MDAALAVARPGLGTTAPNPCVGCVIVRDGNVVGQGRTQPGGRPHAERMALDMAGEAAHGATAYVTLEPCAHTGQTPPCSDALIAAGIARVVVACTDPDPRTSGDGIHKLEAAGIEVIQGIREAEATSHHAGFFFRLSRGWPLVAIDALPASYDRVVSDFGEEEVLTALKRLGAEGLTRLCLVPGSKAARAALDADCVDVNASETHTPR